MESTVTLSRKERRKAEQALESLPVVLSDTPESIEGTDDTVTTEALKTAPTASLPTAPVATGSLPITMPVAQVNVPEADADSDDIESDAGGVSAAVFPAPVTQHPDGVLANEGVNLLDDEDVVVAPGKYRRLPHEIMEQDGVTETEAYEIYQNELDAEDADWAAAQEKAEEAARILREAMEAEQAEAARLAEKAKVERVKAQARAEDRYKGHKRRGIIFLIVAVLFTTAFFLLGGF